MLISSWLKSLSYHLQTRPRRITRDVQLRRGSVTRAESLEVRCLLTSPELIAISPNMGQFVEDGTVLTDRPRELVFQFSPGQTLDAIQIIGSGFDDTFGDGNEISITPGFRGLGDSPDQVVFRFAQPLQDDRYQITIAGTGRLG